MSNKDTELLGHYALYILGIKNGVDGAFVQKFNATPAGVKEDFDAALFEIIGFFMNFIFYFFR